MRICACSWRVGSRSGDPANALAHRSELAAKRDARVLRARRRRLAGVARPGELEETDEGGDGGHTEAMLRSRDAELRVGDPGSGLLAHANRPPAAREPRLRASEIPRNARARSDYMPIE